MLVHNKWRQKINMKKISPKILSLTLLVVSMLATGSVLVAQAPAAGAISDDLEPAGPGG